MSGASITFMPSTSRGTPGPRSRGSPGTTAARKPSRPASASRWGRSRTRRSSPARPISPMADDPGRRGGAGVGRGEGDRHGQVAGGLGQPRAPDRGDEDVVGMQPDAAVLLEHRDDHRDPGGVQPGRRTPWPLGGRRGHQRLYLGQQRASSLHGDRDAGAGDLLVVVLDEQAGRVGDRRDPVVGQVEAAHLVDRAEAVLHRADHAEPGVAVALEVEDHVDDVLEDARAGDRAVLGDVADEHRGDVAGLGDPDQRGGDLLHLGDPAGHAVDVGRPRWSGSSRRPGASGRTCSMWVSTAPRSVSAARKSSSWTPPVRSARSRTCDGGLLAGDVEGAALVARGLGGHLEQERALADSRLAGQQDRRTGDQPAAEHPVELGDAAGAEGRLRADTWPIGTAGLRDRAGRSRPVGAARLGDRAPRLALAAPADPLRGLPAALAAAVRRAGWSWPWRER